MFKKTFIVMILLTFLFTLISNPALCDYRDAREIVKIGGSVEVPEDVVAQTAVAIGGSVTVYGRVLDEAVAIGGSIYIEPGAIVEGDAVAIGGIIDKSEDGVVGGDEVEIAIPGCRVFSGMCRPDQWFQLGLYFKVIGLLMFLALVLLVVALFPKPIETVSKTIEKDLLKTFLIGLVIILVFVPAIVILAITIIGIVLIPLWILLVLVGGLFGYIGLATLVGEKIFQSFKAKQVAIVLSGLVGVLVLGIVGFIPVFGHLIRGLAICWGLGGVAVSRFGSLPVKK